MTVLFSTLLKRLPWRIIKTTLSVIAAASLIYPVTYILFHILLPYYPFSYVSNGKVVYIGSTTFSVYFATMAAMKGVGNTLTDTWRAIRSQMIANFFGAVLGVVIAMTVAEVLGSAHPLTIGSGVFILFLLLKHLKLNDAFTLGGITFISILVLATNDYPPFVRGVDRFFSMAFGLFVAATINIIFLSPTISDKRVYQQLQMVQKRFCLQSELSPGDRLYVDEEMMQLKREVSLLLKDEVLEKRIFFWRKKHYNYQELQRWIQKSSLLIPIDEQLAFLPLRMYEVLVPEVKQLKKEHYGVIFLNEEADVSKRIKIIREQIYQCEDYWNHAEMMKMINALNQYEQLIVEENK